ncbi:MAG: transglycosylase SLT domain-containing protein [Streptosporangiales bacterium]|nr:transglycosylase SLT domain-containing protein [Streptosporangiales bacterium]
MGMRLSPARACLAALLVAVPVGGCAGADGTAGGEAARRRDTPRATGPSGTPPGDRGPGAAPSPAPPAPPAADTALARKPSALAAELARTTDRLNAAIDAWTANPRRAAGAPPAELTLWALHHQRIYRLLAREEGLAERTLERLPDDRAEEARDHITAVREILDLAEPVSVAKARKMRTQDPPPAGTLRRHMRDAERRFDVDWELLAAIMHVETKFGRVKSASSTGAQGPMQFMPPTWQAYGRGGDVHDPRDAILGAANYLKASGAPGDVKRAVFAYNHDDRYVRSVLAHTRRIKADPRAYYTYYNWQVFALTDKGDLRLTGPRGD